MYSDIPDIELIYDKKVLGEPEKDVRQPKDKKYKYMLKTTISGDMVESEIYPVYDARAGTRASKKNRSKKTLENLNHKNSKKQLIRMINTNFTRNDLIMTLTYKDGVLPNEQQTIKDARNYLRKIKNYRKKNNMPPLKYIYVNEYVEDEENTKKIRVHIHLIMSGMDRDVAESFWTKGRKQSKRAEPDDFGLEGFALYLGNHTRKRNKRGWHPSRNLKKPKVYKSVTRLTKKKAESMARCPDKWQEIFEKIYKDRYRYLDCDMFYSDITAGFYLRARMRRRN